jgi:hypothetical protein
MKLFFSLNIDHARKLGGISGCFTMDIIKINFHTEFGFLLKFLFNINWVQVLKNIFETTLSFKFLEEINQNHLKYFFKKLLQNRLKQKSIIVF